MIYRRWNRLINKNLWPYQVRNIDGERYAWITDPVRYEFVIIKRQFTVYMITCTLTDQPYIGVTEKDIEQRFRVHKSAAGYDDSRKLLIQRMIANYGEENFTIKPIGTAHTVEEAFQLEQQMIIEHGTLVSQGGFNVSLKGGSIDTGDLMSRYQYLYREGRAEVVDRIPKWSKRQAMTPEFYEIDPTMPILKNVRKIRRTGKLFVAERDNEEDTRE